MRPSTVGVVIPSYNQKKYFSECIEGVLNQTHLPSQIVVCDDASTDGSQEIIEEYAARHPGLIEAVLHPQNLGLSRNFNSGLGRIHQEYVSMVSADDFWHPDKIRLEVEALENRPEATWAFSLVVDVDEHGILIREDTPDFDPEKGNLVVPMLALKSPIRNALIKVEVLRNVGFFDETFSVVEDLDWRIRLASSGRSAFVPRPTVSYRRHGKGVSSASHETYVLGYRQLFHKYKPIVDKLPPTERKMIERHWRERLDLISRSMVLQHRQQNNPLKTLVRYVKIFGSHPNEWRFKLLLHAALPLRLSNWIAQLRSD